MNKFSWVKSLGYGISLWAIVFIVGAALFAGLNVALGVWAMFLLAVVAGAVSYFFGVELSPQTAGVASSYGLSFVVIGVVLDYFVSNALMHGIFGVWTYWLGYLFILFGPVMAAGAKQSTPHAV